MGLVKYDNEQKKHLRENLKKFTEEQGLAKTDLADKLGYAYNTVISWFNGSRLPSQFGIETLCDFFKVTDVELLGSPMKVRTFAYYRKDELTAVGSLQEIADQTGANVRTLRSLVATTKNLDWLLDNPMVELKEVTE